MAQYETTIDGAWAKGKLTIRSGESIRFVGSVTGVTLRDDGDIKVVFHADGRGAYQYAKGSLDGFATKDTQALIVKHVEQALIDQGFDIDPKVASEDYEP